MGELICSNNLQNTTCSPDAQRITAGAFLCASTSKRFRAAHICVSLVRVFLVRYMERVDSYPRLVRLHTPGNRPPGDFMDAVAPNFLPGGQ